MKDLCIFLKEYLNRSDHYGDWVDFIAEFKALAEKSKLWVDRGGDPRIKYPSKIDLDKVFGAYLTNLTPVESLNDSSAYCVVTHDRKGKIDRFQFSTGARGTNVQIYGVNAYTSDNGFEAEKFLNLVKNSNPIMYECTEEIVEQLAKIISNITDEYNSK